MTDIQLGLVIVVIIAICQAIKYAGLPTRWIPLIAIGLGIAGSFLFTGVTWLTTLAGIITALTASGLFSGFKKTVLNK